MRAHARPHDLWRERVVVLAQQGCLRAGSFR